MAIRILALLLTLVISGCSMHTPPYATSIDNNQLIKRSGIQPVAVGNFTTTKKLNKISLRGSPMHSSVGAGYGDYLNDALVQELKLAKLWSAVSTNVISGELLANDIDISGFSSGEGVITVRFMVESNGAIVFEKTVTANTDIESSFIGAIAIPNGQANYPVLIQEVIKNLFSDPEFIKALQ
tara:strand:- start:1467 stop:2012 length:546 start_codon:yes stop_codon:yes gene_type:complete